jgi:Family of unknown function (DUF5724)/Domain of unknown function (DUF4132)
MLKPEQAQAALEKFHQEDGRERRLAALKKLPAALRKIGHGLLECDPAGEELAGYEESCRALGMAAADLDRTTKKDRLNLFQALFLKLAHHVEAAWQLKHRLPYQSLDEGRKAFRAPNTPAASCQARGTWLRDLAKVLEGYDEDIAWCAAWAAHLSDEYGSDTLGVLLAATIDTGGPEGQAVFDILCDSARGVHEIGAMGRHVSRALLVASKPEGWDFVEKLLLAAQRQEGLRQSILGTVDEAHPEAFRRMLRLILEHDLARFSAIVRAVDVWFGFQWDSASAAFVNQLLEQVLLFLEDPKARQQALAGGKPEATYLALWTLAFEDAEAAIAPAARLLKEKDVERRYVGAYLLGQLRLPAAQKHVFAALQDDDLRVALRALHSYEEFLLDEDPGLGESDLFERVERFLDRLPVKKTSLPALVWPWHVHSADRTFAVSVLTCCLGKRPPARVIPYLDLMESYERGRLVQQLKATRKWDRPTRDTLLALLGDTDSDVREEALKALANCKITAAEAQCLEKMLTRKVADLRRGVFTVLLNQPDDQVLVSAERLLAAPDRLQRLGGLALLRQMIEAKRSPDECRKHAEQMRSGRSRLSKDEQDQLDVLLDAGRPAWTLDDALGLMNPAERTKPVPPRKRDVTCMTPTALECLRSLDALIHEHREAPITYQDTTGTKQELLGNVSWQFPRADHDPELPEGGLPLQEVWETWRSERPRSLRDKDGLELVRALIWNELDEWDWKDCLEAARKSPNGREALATLLGGLKPVKLRYWPTRLILQWLVLLHPPPGAVDFLLDATETAFAMIPAEILAYNVKADKDDPREDWRWDHLYSLWMEQARCFRRLCPSVWTAKQHVRLFHLLRWRDEPGTAVQRCRPDLEEVVLAYQAGGATKADLLDQLLGPRNRDDHYLDLFYSLSQLTSRKRAPAFEACPDLHDLVERCRERVLEVELQRGESPTPATEPALSLDSLYGVDVLVRILQALGPAPFKYSGRGRGRAEVFTHLVGVTFPREADTVDDFARQVKAAAIPTQRLIELCFVARQWDRYVEHALGWPEFADGLCWFIAHTRDTPVGGKEDAWLAQISECTALTEQELTDGAVDVAWFHRVYDALGPKRWAQLSEAARYASNYKRAQFLVEVLLGRARKAGLVADIRKNHTRDAVRALGLLPLARGQAGERDVLERYKIFQEYLHYARQLSAMTRDSALQAAAIGLANLARTAGYPDPVRLEWAMEAQAVADLAKGPVTVKVADVAVALAIDPQGDPELTVVRQGKTLSAIPPAVKKNAKVAALTTRKTELRKQASRMRLSLEQAMCRGDPFTGAELQQLFTHPVLAPRLERLVLVGEGIAGYPVAAGKALRDHAGKTEPVKKGEQLRLAHPHDLLLTRAWHLWQRDCFAAERVQPFKQVFRELYVVTAQEKADRTVSHRYAGQQVNPKQAVALWGGRGWVVNEDEGVRRTFHDAGLSASVTFLGDTFTPAAVEGLTIEGVSFSKRGEWKPLPLVDIPPRIFSEVMRDLDLVVSVAHRGGVDPEASASTVDMRAALLRETCSLLKIDNVRIKQSQVLIDGRLSNYSVHLGSAVTHRQPGGALCLVPVHAQHRGRLFLPFADDDPRTAEVISKVLLLARDEEIKDPSILDQLRTMP